MLEPHIKKAGYDNQESRTTYALYCAGGLPKRQFQIDG